MPPIPLSLDRATPIDVRPGGEIIVSGSCYVPHDGSRVDAATTQWPKDAPGGESTDPIGIVDLEASGLSLASRDPKAHTATFIANAPGAMCKAAGIEGACIIPRTAKLALDRGITRMDLVGQAKCDLTVEVPSAPLAPLRPAFPFLGVTAAIGAVAVFGLVALRMRKRRMASPTGQLLALAKRVQGKLVSADVVVAAPLGRAVDTALRALKAGRVDPASAEGKRVADVLLRVETQLDSHAAEARAEEERAAADELVREVESALEAAEEANAIGARTAK